MVIRLPNKNSFRHFKHQMGFTLLELLLVIALVALLGAASVPFFLKIIDRTERITVQVTANRFASTVAILRSQWVIKNSLSNSILSQQSDLSPSVSKNMIGLDSQYIIFNESGWPVNTISMSDDKKLKKYQLEGLERLSSESCLNLWNGIIQSDTDDIANEKMTIQLKQTMSNKIEGVEVVRENSYRFLPQLIDKNICRFRLITKRDANYYFDFNLLDGRILTPIETLD